MLAQYRFTGRSVSALSREIATAVSAGHLRPGERLPSVRALASYLGVSPSTVAAAYAHLRRSGVVVTRERGGTRVNDRPSIGGRHDAVVVPAGVRDLATGNPDPLLLPDLRPALRAAAADVCGGGRVRLYGEEPNVDELVDLVRERRMAALTASPADIALGGSTPRGDAGHSTPPQGAWAGAVLSGALDAIERVLAGSVPPGGKVAIEDPGYDSLLGLIRALGLTAVAVPVDEHGPRVEDVRDVAATGVHAIVITSRAQNPTGAALTPQRADDLAMVLAEHRDLMVIENDHLGDAAGVPLHTVARDNPRWAYVHSFAKTLGPDLRVAVLLGDVDTIDRVRSRQAIGPGWVSELLQRTVVRLLEQPTTGRTIERARETYRLRRTALLDACRALEVPAIGTSGFNVWVPVRDETTAVTSLLTAGWAVAPGSRYRQRTPAGIRITVADLDPHDAHEIARVLHSMRHGRPRRSG